MQLIMNFLQVKPEQNMEGIPAVGGAMGRHGGLTWDKDCSPRIQLLLKIGNATLLDGLP